MLLRRLRQASPTCWTKSSDCTIAAARTSTEGGGHAVHAAPQPRRHEELEKLGEIPVKGKTIGLARQ